MDLQINLVILSALYTAVAFSFDQSILRQAHNEMRNDSAEPLDNVEIVTMSYRILCAAVLPMLLLLAGIRAVTRK